MQQEGLDYDDLGETDVSGQQPSLHLHELRAVLVSTDPVLGRRVRRILEAMGARLSTIPDWGHVSLSEIRGLDPQLILLEPDADLRTRAVLNRRLAEEPRLRWAMVDRVPRHLEALRGVDRLAELSAIALGAERQLESELVLSEGPFLAPIDATGFARILRTVAANGPSKELRYEADAVSASIRVHEGRIQAAEWRELGPSATELEGTAALTALSALRGGDVHILPIADDDAAPADGTLGRLGTMESATVAELLEAAARPELAWVATRVATGRYLFPPPGAAPIMEGDLPEASRTRRSKGTNPATALPPVLLEASESAPERQTAPSDMKKSKGLAPLAGSRTTQGIAPLEMPRMPRASGPKAVVDEVAREKPETKPATKPAAEAVEVGPNLEATVRVKHGPVIVRSIQKLSVPAPENLDISSASAPAAGVQLPDGNAHDAQPNAQGDLAETGDDTQDAYDDAAASSLHLDVKVELEEAPAESPPVNAPVIALSRPEEAAPAEAAATPGPTPRVPVTAGAPVTAADSIRPALTAAPVGERRRVLPLLAGAVAVLGLGVAAVIGIGWVVGDPSESLASAGTLLEDLEIPGLDIGELGDLGDFDGIESIDEDANSENTIVDIGAAPATPESGAMPSSVVQQPEDSDTPEPADPPAPDGVEASDMTFGLTEADEDRAAAARRAERRRLRRAERAERADSAPADVERAAAPGGVDYEAVLDRDPRNAIALVAVARARLAGGDARAAIELAERAVRERPRNAPIFRLLGDAYSAAGDATTAERAYARAAALDPSQPAAEPSSEVTTGSETAATEAPSPNADTALEEETGR